MALTGRLTEATGSGSVRHKTRMTHLQKKTQALHVHNIRYYHICIYYNYLCKDNKTIVGKKGNKPPT